MDRDCYQVEVLYYLNPHLIWVEVIDKGQQDFVFEQIGIYGVLPFETALDLEGKGLKGQSCDDWVVASSVSMKKALLDAKKVWFRPTHIDRRTSIFDDNIHKYGEIIIKTSDGKKVELSKILVDSGFALFNICLFHQELSNGNLKTKLNHAETQDIIKHLEKDTRTSSKKHRQSSVKKQTTVFHAADNMGLVLTESNLRRHERVLSAKVDVLMEKKSKDFELCKDVDDKSLGRGSRCKKPGNDQEKSGDIVITTEASRVPMFLRKKLELTKTQNVVKNDPLQVLLATKQYLEANARVVQSNTPSNVSENSDLNFKNEKKGNDSTEKLGLETQCIVLDSAVNNNPDSLNISPEYRPSIENQDCHKDIVKKTKQSVDSFVDLEMNDVKVKRNPNRRPKKSKTNFPEYNIVKEKLVAYGPPGINSTHLPLKIVPRKTEEDEENALVSREEHSHEEPKKSQDMYADVDSEVDIEITNKAVLKDVLDATNTSFNVTTSSVDLNVNVSNASTQVLDQSKDLEVSKIVNLNNSYQTEESIVSPYSTSKLALMQRKLKLLKDKNDRKSESLMSSTSDTTAKDSSVDITPPKKSSHLDSDDEASISDLVKKINIEYEPKSIKTEMEKQAKTTKVTPIDFKNNVNPFKNIDSSLSVFVDKLVSPVLMVHNKMNEPIGPISNIRDVNFNTHIHVVLKNIGVERPMMLQMVSWPVILRGYSLFMIGPMGSGKTFGYLPAVCRLITDDSGSEFVDSVGPTCIIVCATAQSVTEVEHYAKMFLGLNERVVSCFAGVDELHLTTSLLNGCELFICTPSVLVRLLQLTDFGIDLRRLSTFVLEDCERLSEVYASELKYFLIKIREMLKTRVNKERKVQFVVASRVWCDFMENLAKKSPNSVVCIGAFQECVLYSKANTTVEFLMKENKINKALDFLSEVDGSKKTVIVCLSNDEVEALSKVLIKNKFVVFATNDTMTVDELYSLSKAWEDYEEPLLAPVLVCCDGNLNHLNVTDAHHLLHYSLPHLFSMFCKRFSVLNDNYASIFKGNEGNVRIKVFLEDSNKEQFPKILNFVKRCTDQVPQFLDTVCESVLQEKDLMKAKRFVPICDNVLAYGECPDFWNCLERHVVFKEQDEPKDWMPRNGVVTFKILHYHTPIHYSVRLLSSKSNGNTIKYPQAYSTLSLKLGMYFSKENNRKLHGIPQIGDVCAVSVKQNFFVRCQVLKILTRYNNGTPNCVLVKLIDEEKLEKTRDVYLYHLPEELKGIETHIVQLRLANVRPKDKDITFSDLARDMLKKLTSNDDDLYMRGQVVLTVGNCIMVDTLEACQDLTTLNETVVMHNLKKELLNTHAIVNPEHMVKIEKVCGQFIVNEKEKNPRSVSTKKQKEKLKPQWAHLEDGDMSPVFFASAESPGMFFIRLAKFESCMNLLIKDMAKYLIGDPKSLERATIGDIVLAKFPDDAVFERARIDDIINEDVVKCFFVDQGDWRDVLMQDMVKIPSRFITQMPFQAIECRLIGVEPAGDDWTEFGTNWFYDNCFDDNGDPKMLYVKYFTKEDSEHTDGRKYGVAMIDTSGDEDVVINQLMIDLNLAQENDEIINLQKLEVNDHRNLDNTNTSKDSSDEEELEDLPKPSVPVQSNSLVPVNNIQEQTAKEPLSNLLSNVMKQPIRSVPLVDSDNESSDSWDIVNPKDLVSILKGVTSVNVDNQNKFNEAGFETQKNVNKEDTNFEILKKPAEVKKISKPLQTASDNLIKDVPKNETPHINAQTVLDQIKGKTTETNQLDSDDFSSTEGSQISESVKPSTETPIVLTETANIIQPIDLNKIDELRKPKLLWRQNKTSVSIKIQLIGTEKYELKLKERSLKFDALCNDVKYGFDFELYGVVEDMVHSDKGQYILVKLNKVIKKNWLSLTKDSCVRKWIVYDVDSIDTSSDEEENLQNTLAQVASELHESDGDTDSDEDFLDDINYEYKRDI